MPRVSNQAKWDALQAELHRRELEFAASVFDGNIPDRVYSVLVSNGDIEQRIIYRVGYRHDTDCMYHYGAKPTTKNVAALKEYLDSDIQFEPGKILFYWTCKDLEHTAKGATDFFAINEGKFDFLDLEQATEKARQVAAEHQRKKDLLAAGWITCCYCGAARHPKDIVYDRIISPNWKHQNYRSDPRPYCRDKGCLGYDQMAHEG